MSSISLFDIISVVIFPDGKICLCIPVSAADAAGVNPKGIKTFLANGLSFLLMVILFLVMDRVMFQEILLIVLS